VRALKGIYRAVQFLTILPLPHNKKSIEPKKLAESMAYFPLVGLFIGLGLFFVYTGLTGFITPLLTAVIVAGVWAWFTGALHLEGFVDAADGFSSGPDKEKILLVMKDKHCGSKGAVALVFLIIIKIALLEAIPVSVKFYALMLAPVISRWAMVFAAVFCDYARKTEGFGKAFVKNVGIREMVVASSILIVAGVVLLQAKFFVLIIPALVFTVASIIYLKNKINGITGDVLGGLNEIVEVISLSAFLLLG
jgi:adenosylcobinamide-GDP ribazoletransferase